TVKEHRDTSSRKYLYFAGNAADDYGLNKILFKYRFIKSSDNTKTSEGFKSTSISGKSGLNKEFTHFWSLDELNILPDDELEYYFEVWDNDAVNGSKSAKSQLFTYHIPSADALKKEGEKDSKALKSEMKEAVEESLKLQKEIDQFNRKLMEKPQLNWEDRKQF